MKSPTPASPSWADLSAAALSGLCLVHCLALPMLASILPVLGAWSRAEWVHVAFVALAVPLSVAALRRTHRRRALPARMWAMAVTGLAALGLGAMGWPTTRWETPITVAGSLLLVAVHAWNLHRGHRH